MVSHDIVVLGGLPTDVGLPSSFFDVAPSDCNDVEPGNIAFAFKYADQLPITKLAQVYGQQTIAMLADMHGIPPNSVRGDCLCHDLVDIDRCDALMPCTFHPNVNTDAICGPAQTGVNTSAQMLAEFGPHP